MKLVLTAAASALALGLAVPAQATQQTGMQHSDMQHSEMTAAQKAMYDSWPADRRMTYDNWPSGVQGYYFTLTPTQQNAFWMLNDEQRLQLYNLPANQRMAAWDGVLAQVNAMQGQTGTMNQPANRSTMTSGNVRFVSNAVVQNAPPPHQGEYPVCGRDQDDNCMNAWEAGRRGAGVPRPLEYWPGRPASEIDETLPATMPSRN
jgi:hypothetical protein